MTGCPLLDSEYAARQNGKRLPCERLAEENAKLRKLVRDIWDAYRCEEVAPNVAKHWHDRMRELGVEVDE